MLKPTFRRWIWKRYSQRNTPPILGSCCMEKSDRSETAVQVPTGKPKSWRIGSCPARARIGHGHTYLYGYLVGYPTRLWYYRDGFRTYVVLILYDLILTCHLWTSICISFSDIGPANHGPAVPWRWFETWQLSLQVLGIATKARSTDGALSRALGHGQTAQ